MKRIIVSPDHSPNSNKCMIGNDYLKSLLKVGLIPVVATLDFDIIDSRELARNLMEDAGGLLLSGGGDIDPKYFDEEPSEKLGPIDTYRDRLEMDLIKEALEREKPILGICRGAQILNVALGGSLYQDIPSEIQGAYDHATCPDRTKPVHEVEVNPESRLHRIANTLMFGVNSLHHQAVKIPGKGVNIVAWSKDSVVEAIELDGADFVLGVQWHPENMASTDPIAFNIFDNFAKAVRKR